jgi:hypothetical protein
VPDPELAERLAEALALVSLDHAQYAYLVQALAAVAPGPTAV